MLNKSMFNATLLYYTGTELFAAGASPLLYEVMWGATSMVPSPNPGFTSVYDEWMNTSSALYRGAAKAKIGNLGSGSDYMPFLQLQGISSANIGYVSVRVS